MKDIHSKSITEISEFIREKKITPLELVKNSLERIEVLNPKLNAFITVLAEEALEEAKSATEEIKSGNWKGPMHGIPYAVKDMFDTAGIRTTAAFRYFEKRIPKKDAVVVQKMKQAGAILIGKTNMHELAMGTTSVVSHFGTVHNPWNLNYIAGGSSGGSAAAIAAGLCFATIDTDAIGSCRLPASCCGVTGFKASYGLIDLSGVLEGEKADDLILKLAHAGLMTNAVQDIPILLNILSEPSVSKSEFKSDYTSALQFGKKLKIGIVQNFKSSEDLKHSFLKVVEVFREQGHILENINIPSDFIPFNIQSIEKERGSISSILFENIDVLVLPTTTDLTPTIKAAKAAGPTSFSSDNTYFANHYGLPAISIPFGLSQDGLPLGFQIVGRHWGEGEVLSLAHSYQKQAEWKPNLRQLIPG